MTGLILVLALFVGCNHKNPQLGYELYLSGLKSYSEKDFSAAETIISNIYANMPNDLNKLESIIENL